MLDYAFQLVAVAVVLGVIFVITQAAIAQRYRFVIKIVSGELRVTKGKVRADFLDDIREICRENGVRFGWIAGVMEGKRVALRFSGSFSPSCQQRLRNAWLQA
jgi:hypothetical protein